MHSAISLTQVSVRYKGADRNALTHVTFSLEQGECALIQGMSGSGKTTLCRCLNGIVPQALDARVTGSIAVAGKDVATFRVQTLSRDIGFVMQDPEVQIVGRTVAEDLAFGSRNFLVPRQKIEHRMPMVLAQVGLDGYENRICAELSGGEKQRLAIAGILMMAPSVLILDDPASEMDPAGRAQLYALLHDLKHRQGLTLVLVDRDSPQSRFLADRVFVMDEGCLTPLPKPQGPTTPSSWPSSWPASWPGPLPNSWPAPDSTPQTFPHGPVQLEIRNLTAAYPGSEATPVLKDICLEIRKGEFIALMGHNGAGKTSLARHLNGLLPSPPGSVLLNQKDVCDLRPMALTRSVGLVFQNPDHQMFESSVAKEIEVGLSALDLPQTEKRCRLDRILELTDLAGVRHCHPFTLGKGVRQRVALASILVLEPEILLVDEPFTGLDDAGCQAILALLKTLNQAGTTVIVITHDLEMAAAHCRRLLVMARGELVVDTPTATLNDHSAELIRAGVLSAQVADTAPVNAGAKPSAPAASRVSSGPARGFDIRSKLALALTFMAVTLCVNHPAWHAAVLAGVVGSGFFTGLTLKEMMARLLPLLPLFIAIALLTGFTGIDSFVHPGHRTLLFSLGNHLHISTGGLLLGATFLLRLTNMGVATQVFMAATPLDDMISLMSRLRMPPSVAFVITTAIRFIPALDNKRQRILEAQKSRGIDFSQGAWPARFRHRLAIMVPLIVNAIIVADQLTMALMNRGFGYTRQWTVMTQLCFRTRDTLLTLASLAALVCVVIVRFYFGYGLL